MKLIESSFSNDGRSLVLRCAISSGWDEHKNTYCFSEQDQLDWKSDYKLRVTVSVFPRPSGLDPRLRTWEGVNTPPLTSGGITYAFSEGVGKITVPILKPIPEHPELPGTLNTELPWNTVRGKPQIHVLVPNAARGPSTRYELQLLLVFHPPPLTKPDLKDWESQFFSGGLPSLGKRR